ncbi:MAG: hypothetical protein Q4P18_03560 [Methanobrevibacter sp.]|uniref:hypothetical protein n=1 Tax=Methanobrevibacter sp. TaxID=66852 RepID=UPI0026DFA461|nr:hypothetical protein [Methanobrevibacter sp.]MDO5848587.1 hypothetical protein [Methanobrevibacter sp.]
MGQTIKHKCNSCDFEFIEEDKEFYFNEELTKLTEETPLFNTFQKIAKSQLSGNIYLTYCDNCNNFIKTYSVTKNETSLDDEEIKELIIESGASEQITNEPVEKLVLIRNDDRLIKCPKCENEILKTLTHGSGCPKCENGKLLANMFTIND